MNPKQMPGNKTTSQYPIPRYNPSRTAVPSWTNLTKVDMVPDGPEVLDGYNIIEDICVFVPVKTHYLLV